MKLFLLIASLATTFSLAMELPKSDIGHDDEIINFNFGGYLFDVARKTLGTSGSEFLKVFLSNKFAQKKDKDGRFFIGCSPEIGKIFSLYVCGQLVVHEHDIDLIESAGDFLSCTGLKEIASIDREKQDLEDKYKLLSIRLDEFLYQSSKTEICLCPLTEQAICQSDNGDLCFFLNSLLEHLIASHTGQVDHFTIKRERNGKYKFLLSFRYKSTTCKKSDLGEFVIAACTLSSFGIPPCPFCSNWLINYIDTGVKKHLQECGAKYDCEFLFSGKEGWILRHKKIKSNT